jgi:replicative DNA helicase
MSTKAPINNQNRAIGRVMPNSLEAEQCVLGCVLIDNDASINAFGKISEVDFYSPVHKMIYTAMHGVFEQNLPVDLVTLSNALSINGNLENCGGIEYLTSLSNTVPSSANMHHYIDILKKRSTCRKLINAGNKIIEESYTSEDEKRALASAEKLIFDISREGEHRDLTVMGDELPAVLERLDTIQRDPTALRGVKTGFYGLDRITNGLQKADLIILGARPSVGKTSMGLNILLHAAIKGKKKVAIFSLEMSKQSLAMRALCSVAKVSLTKALRGELSSEEWKRIWIANKTISEADIYVDDNSVITPAEITSKCMRLRREKGLDLVMVDYLGLMTGGGARRESRQVEVADNSRYMKILAKELEVPVILLSQLNRGIESRKGAESKPALSDLRESGAIEQDADLVMFIHKEKPAEGEVATDEVELIIAKHRNGPLDTIKLKWVGEYTSFENLKTDQTAQDARDSVKAVSDKEKATAKEKETKETEGKEQVTSKGKKVTQEKLPELKPLAETDATDVF